MKTQLYQIDRPFCGRTRVGSVLACSVINMGSSFKSVYTHSISILLLNCSYRSIATHSFPLSLKDNSSRRITSSQQSNQSTTQHGTSLEFFPPEVAREIRSYLNETADKKNIRLVSRDFLNSDNPFHLFKRIRIRLSSNFTAREFEQLITHLSSRDCITKYIAVDCVLSLLSQEQWEELMPKLIEITTLRGLGIIWGRGGGMWSFIESEIYEYILGILRSTKIQLTFTT